DQFQAGTRLQLPLYLLAASHALRQHGMEVAWQDGEAQYFFATRRGDLKRVRFSGRTLASRWDEFERMLGVFADRISGGDFHPEPGQAGRTQYYM
ncbi:MAG: PD-(D/E)XK nuclease family protein, partial [Anaerolineae bacterium]|nr:PD-(D/E)XK nuclease family protein [Anaerolineae bacterium]